MIPQELARKLGKEAVRIIDEALYHAPSGRLVDISNLVEYSVRGTRSYPPDAALLESITGSHQTEIAVENRTTLAAARRLVNAGRNPRGS
jgi:uncharacterized protein (TIGR02452 family)